MRRLLSWALLSLCIMSANAVDNDEEDPYLLLCGEADQALAEGRYYEAIQRYTDAIAMCPERPQNSMLLSNIGQIYGYAGDDSLSVVSFERALKMAPGLRPAMMGRAKALLRMHRNDDAYEAFSQLIEVDSLNYEARYMRGTMSLFGDNIAVAEADFEVMNSLKPTDPDNIWAHAMLYSSTGRHHEAIPYLKKILEIEPSAEFYVALANAYLAESNLSEASATLNEGIGQYSEDAELYLCRAILNKALYRMDEARKDASAALRYGADPKQVSKIIDTKGKR